MKLIFLAVVQLLITNTAFAQQSSECNQTLWKQQIGRGAEPIYIVAKNDITFEAINEGWTNTTIFSSNKKLVVKIKECPVFVGRSNNFDFINDMRASLENHIRGIQDQNIFLDLTDLNDRKDSTGGLINLEVLKHERIRPALVYADELEEKLIKLNRIVGR